MATVIEPTLTSLYLALILSSFASSYRPMLLLPMLDVLPLPEVEADQSNQGHRPHQVTSSQPSISSPASTSPSTGQATINIASKLDALGEFIKLNTNFFVDKNSWVQLFHLCKGRSNLNRRIHPIPPSSCCPPPSLLRKE